LHTKPRVLFEAGTDRQTGRQTGTWTGTGTVRQTGTDYERKELAVQILEDKRVMMCLCG